MSRGRGDFVKILPRGRPGLLGVVMKFVWLACPLTILGGCLTLTSERHPERFVSTTPSSAWTAPSQGGASYGAPEPLPAIPEELRGVSQKLTLNQLLEVAARNRPSLRGAWYEARAAAAGWASARGEYYPSLEGSVSGMGGRLSQTSGLSGFRGLYAELGVGLRYLLLDFGGREARVEEAWQSLLAANWVHSQAVQDLLRDVPQAFYTYTGEKAQLKAAETSLKEAETDLEATEERRRAGVSTLADVLQAKARADAMRLKMVQARGDVEIARGRLATAVGWAADTTFDVAEPVGDLAAREMALTVREMIRMAQHERPDFQAARALIRQKEAALREAEAALGPQLSALGEAGWSAVDGKAAGAEDIKKSQFAYYGGLMLEFPLFEGFSLRNAVRKAKAELEAARAAMREKQEQVTAEVWESYTRFQTAVQALETSQSLLESAEEAHRVSLARYKAGAADIVELLNAQSTLAEARAQLVQARTGVRVSYAELLHAIGSSLSQEAP